MKLFDVRNELLSVGVDEQPVTAANFFSKFLANQGTIIKNQAILNTNMKILLQKQNILRDMNDQQMLHMEKQAADSQKTQVLRNDLAVFDLVVNVQYYLKDWKCATTRGELVELFGLVKRCSNDSAGSSSFARELLVSFLIFQLVRRRHTQLFSI